VTDDERPDNARSDDWTKVVPRRDSNARPQDWENDADAKALADEGIEAARIPWVPTHDA
jgi:hypothetical protein